MSWELCRTGRIYHFSSAHFLPNVHEGHKCKRMHGHNYVAEVEVRGEIAERNGFNGGIDFADMDKQIKPIIDRLDHHLLNDIPGLENPTAENIALYLLKEINAVRADYFSVKVWETDKCWAMVVNKGGLFRREHKE